MNTGVGEKSGKSTIEKVFKKGEGVWCPAHSAKNLSSTEKDVFVKEGSLHKNERREEKRGKINFDQIKKRGGGGNNNVGGGR